MKTSSYCKTTKNRKFQKQRSYKTLILDIKSLKHLFGSALMGLTFLLFLFGYIKTIDFNHVFSSQKITSGASPIINAYTDALSLNDRIKKDLNTLSKAIIGYDPRDCLSVINGSIPVSAASYADFKTHEKQKDTIAYPQTEKETKETTSEITPVNEALNIPPENQAPIKSIDGAQKSPNAISNETSYSIDIPSMLSDKPDINTNVSGPLILITHTHATESYAPRGSSVYDITASDRSTDKSKNVVAVGDTMAKAFEEKGIGVIHDTVLHDEPSFNGSYAHSLASVESYKSKYPSIQIVLDVHRDSIVYDDKTKAKTLTHINDRPAAQLMLVVGTDEKGLYNPDWRFNMMTALHFQQAVFNRYPTLMRHINLRRERFNGHTSHASLIIETGTSGNTLEEATYAARLFADAVGDYLNSL